MSVDELQSVPEPFKRLQTLDPKKRVSKVEGD